MLVGRVAEKIMEELLNCAGYTDVSHLYSTKDLLTKAEEIKPGWVAQIEEERRKKLKETNWDYIPPRLVFDWVYGIDYLIAPQGVTRPTRFGFDITVDPQKVIHKHNRFVDNHMLWRAIGITKVGVVLVLQEGDKGFRLLDGEEVEERVDRLLNDVIFLMAENKSSIGKYVLNI